MRQALLKCENLNRLSITAVSIPTVKQGRSLSPTKNTAFVGGPTRRDSLNYKTLK